MKIPTSGNVYKCVKRVWGKPGNKLHSQVPDYKRKTPLKENQNRRK